MHVAGRRPQGSARVAAHPVEEDGCEAVGELVCAGIPPQPCVGPVHRGERNERGGAVVEVGAQLATLAAFAKERAEALFIAAALGDEEVTALAFEIPPFADEDGRDVELLCDDAEVTTERCANPLD